MGSGPKCLEFNRKRVRNMNGYNQHVRAMHQAAFERKQFETAPFRLSWNDGPINEYYQCGFCPSSISLGYQDHAKQDMLKWPGMDPVYDNEFMKSIRHINKPRFVLVRSSEECLSDFNITFEDFKARVLISGINEHLLQSLKFFNSPNEPHGLISRFYLIMSLSGNIGYVGCTGWCWYYRHSNYQISNKEVAELLKRKDVKLCFFAWSDIREDCGNGNMHILEELEVFVAKMLGQTGMRFINKRGMMNQ